MESNTNIQIVQRLLELSKNEIGGYSIFPRNFKEERIWLANILSDSMRQHEAEFAQEFREIVGHYKSSLKEGKGYGWFHSPEKLAWKKMQINQLIYAIYGDKYTNAEKELKFNKKLGNDAYRDFICQIDPTVLMTPAQLKKHNSQCNKIASEILSEILKEKEKNK